MLTRRGVLKGAAAASIAALASAHNSAVAAAAPGSNSGFGLSIGNLENGGLGAFDKHPDSFGVFVRWKRSSGPGDEGPEESRVGADLIFKDSPSGVEVFQKVFDKGWTPVTSFFLKILPSLDGAEASFTKFDKARAEFFIKGENNIGVIATVETNADGVQIGKPATGPARRRPAARSAGGPWASRSRPGTPRPPPPTLPHRK